MGNFILIGVWQSTILHYENQRRYFCLSSGPISIGDLPRTRSGRTVKPPVQHWVGQRYVYSCVTDTVDVERPDLSVTPASDVSLSATPVVTFKVDPVSFDTQNDLKMYKKCKS